MQTQETNKEQSKCCRKCVITPENNDELDYQPGKRCGDFNCPCHTSKEEKPECCHWCLDSAKGICPAHLQEAEEKKCKHSNYNRKIDCDYCRKIRPQEEKILQDKANLEKSILDIKMNAILENQERTNYPSKLFTPTPLGEKEKWAEDFKKEFGIHFKDSIGELQFAIEFISETISLALQERDKMWVEKGKNFKIRNNKDFPILRKGEKLVKRYSDIDVAMYSKRSYNQAIEDFITLIKQG